jgi:cell division septum initiation protein DivIVA
VSGTGHTTDFQVVEQGYDPSQVDQYLATQMLQLREQLDTATTRIAELEAELAAAREREDAIQLTMVAATKARDELLQQAKADAAEIVGAARREAFALTTETSQEADRAIVESKGILTEARRHALSIVDDAEEETKRLIGERQQALVQLHAHYEAESTTLIDRINTLRKIADDLTARTAPPPTTSPDSPPANEGRTADASRAENTPNHESAGDAPIADRIRGSFSGRRSVKLPRIGEEAGRSALAAANAMRAHLSHEPDESGTPDDDDLAVRSA